MDYDGTNPPETNNKMSDPYSEQLKSKCAKPETTFSRSDSEENMQSDPTITDANIVNNIEPETNAFARRANSLDRKQRKSQRRQDFHDTLQVNRSMRFIRNKSPSTLMRPDSPVPGEGALLLAKLRQQLFEYEKSNAILEQSNGALVAQVNELQRQITSSPKRNGNVFSGLTQSSSDTSDDEMNKTLIPAEATTSAEIHQSTINENDSFTLVRNKKPNTPKKAPVSTPIQISPNIYAILPCPATQINTKTTVTPKTTISSTATKPTTTNASTSSTTHQTKTSASVNTNNTVPKANKTKPKAMITKKSKRPPPIIAYGLPVKTLTAAIPQSLSNYTLKKVNNNCTHVLTDSTVDHQSMKEILKNEKVSFHTYTPREDRRTNLVLRNLCSSYNETDVFNAINDLQLNIMLKSVTQFATEKSRREKNPLKMWLVQLEPGSDVEALLKSTKLLHQMVYFEHRQTKGISQCHNCQHFGHSSTNCSRPYRCVKCTNTHLPKECALETLRKESSIPVMPKCVNCQQDHAANYRGCPAYLRYINIKAEKINAARSQTEIRHQAYNNTRQPNVSYAKVLQQSQPTRSTNTPTAPPSSHQKGNFLDFIESECNSKFGLDLNALLEKASSFVPKYVTLPEKEKPLALIKFALSIAPHN